MGYLTIKTSDWQLANINIIPGFSGGGIFNMSGELIGITWGAVLESNTGIFERLEDIHKFVNENKLL